MLSKSKAAASSNRKENKMKTKTEAIWPANRTNQSLCSICWELFSTSGNFDRHRKAGKCLDPEDLDMHLTDEGVWKANSSPGVNFKELIK